MSAHERDGDPRGVRAAWSAGAVSGQRGGAGGSWSLGGRGVRADPSWGGAVSVGVVCGSAVC